MGVLVGVEFGVNIWEVCVDMLVKVEFWDDDGEVCEDELVCVGRGEDSREAFVDIVVCEGFGDNDEDGCADMLIVCERVEDVHGGDGCVIKEPISLVTEPRMESSTDSRPSEMATVLVGNKEPTRDESREESKLWGGDGARVGCHLEGLVREWCGRHYLTQIFLI
jgi:hypothetical protein